MPILRLRWQGDPDNWAIGIYKASSGQYTETELPAAFGGAKGRWSRGHFRQLHPCGRGLGQLDAWELGSAGYRVMLVLQAWEFVPGTNFIDFMDRGVAEAAAVIAVLSRSYLSSRFGKWEWQTAILANPDDPAAKLITVRVEECPL
ncbi:MAG TPA: toll/interleukin-1 receptor domain-containing protein, partial [Trebonia sp.]